MNMVMAMLMLMLMTTMLMIILMVAAVASLVNPGQATSRVGEQLPEGIGHASHLP